jgi:hypothetical protein
VSREALRIRPALLTDDSAKTENCRNAQYAQDYFSHRVVDTRTHQIANPPAGYEP